MLYLVGGAARSGKSTLARRLMSERGVPYVSTDYLVSGLHTGAPDLGIRHEDLNPGRSIRVWPILEPMARNIVEVETAYTVEGDVLVPEGVAAMRAEYPGQIQACFLAYPDWSPHRAIEVWSTHPDPINDWLAGLSSGELVELAEEMVAYSRWLREECRRWALPFIDVGMGRSQSQERAMRALLSVD